MALSKLNLDTNENQGWMDRFQITAGYDDLEVLVLGANNNTKIFAFYNGSGAISLTNYKNFPIGTWIFDDQAHKIHLKNAASETDTWLSSAAFT